MARFWRRAVEHRRDLWSQRRSGPAQEWSLTTSDFQRAADKVQREEVLIRRPDWHRTPRALAGRLRRAQASLRALGIDIAFHPEGRAGSRMIRMSAPSSATSASSAPMKQGLEIE